MLDSFIILRPWFLILVPLIIFILWKLAQLISHQNPWTTSVSEHLQAFMISTGEESGMKTMTKHQKHLSILFGLLLLGLIGPAFWKKPLPGVQIKPQVVILLDQSLSMLADDVKPSRNKRAKYIVQDILDQVPDASAGLIAYAGTEHQLVPITYALDIVKQSIDSIDPQLMPSPGNNPTIALGAVSASLANIPKATLIWLTDDIKKKDENEVVKYLQRQTYKTVIIGMGSENPAPIPLRSGDLLRDRSGNIVLPDYDESRMKNIAQAAGAAFYDQQSLYGEQITQLAQIIKSETGSKDNSKEEDSYFDEWEDLGPWFLIPAALLFASFFRKGYLFAFVLLLPLHYPQEAMAATYADKDAYQLYQEKQYAEAALTADDPLLKGTALYKGGLYEEAAKELAKAAAIENPKEADKNSYLVRAYYNFGNALAQTGKLDAAIGAYDQVLKWVPNHTDALANKKIVEELKNMEQMEKQNQEDSQGGDANNSAKNSSEGGGGSPDGNPSASNSGTDKAEMRDAEETASREEAEKSQQEALEEAMENLTQDPQQSEDTQEKSQASLDDKKQESDNDDIQEDDEEFSHAQTPEQEESIDNPHLNQLQMQPGAVLRNKMIRQYQRSNQRNTQQGSQDDIW